MRALGPISWFLLNVWFFLFMTRTEFPSLGTFAGLSYLLRGLAGFLLFFQLLYLHRIGMRQKSVIGAILILLIFLFGNFSNPSLFVFITGFGILMGLIMGGLIHSPESREIFKGLIRIYILVNLIGLFFAAITYYGAGLEIDFHGIMFPWSAARVREFMGFFRITGFQIEPGTYTATMYFCALLSAVLRGRIFGRLETIAVLSTLSTMSAWAAFAIASYVSGCLIEALLNRRHSTRLLKGLAMIVATVPFIGLFNIVDIQNTAYIQYFLDRFTTEDASGSMVMKLQAWDAWTSKLGVEMLLPRPLSESFCALCASPQDLGTLINMLWFMGLIVSIPLLLWLSIMAIRHVGPGLFLMSLPLIVAKFYFFDPSLWFYFGLLLFFPLQRRMSASDPFRKHIQQESRFA